MTQTTQTPTSEQERLTAVLDAASRKPEGDRTPSEQVLLNLSAETMTGKEAISLVTNICLLLERRLREAG